MPIPLGSYPIGGPIVETSFGLLTPTEELRDAGAVSLYGGLARRVNEDADAWVEISERAFLAISLATIIANVVSITTLPRFPGVPDLGTLVIFTLPLSIPASTHNVVLLTEPSLHQYPLTDRAGNALTLLYPGETILARYDGTNFRVAARIGGTHTSQPVTHTHPLRVGWSAAATGIDETAILAGVVSDDNAIQIPSTTGNLYLWVWRSDVDGGDPTNVYIQAGSQIDQRNIFGVASTQDVSSIAGHLIVSNVRLRSYLYADVQLRVV